jgi:hypothetical protein
MNLKFNEYQLAFVVLAIIFLCAASYSFGLGAIFSAIALKKA